MAGTKISYISGIGADNAPLTINTGSAIAKQPYIEYLGMSEAKLLVTLGRESQMILLTTYPNHPDSGAWQRNIQRADNILSGKGGEVTMAGTDTATDRQFIQFLDYAQPKVQACFMHGIQGDPFAIEDCGYAQGFWDFDPDRTDGSMIYIPANDDFYGCSMRNARKKGIQAAINKYLEECSHHVLYNFVGNANDVPQIVTTKSFFHTGFILETMRLTGLSRDAVTLWLRNGVMRECAKKGMGAKTPEECIGLLIEAKDNDEFDIGNPNRDPRIGIDPITVGLIIALASLLVRAYALTLQYKLAMAEKDGSAFAASSLALLGTFEASPNNKDFKIGSGTNTGGGITVPCPTGYTRNAQGQCVPTTPITPPASGNILGLTKRQLILAGAGAAALVGGVLIFSGKSKSA